MSNASDYNQRVQESLQNELPYILASEVVDEFQKRCSNGMQYTTFPNRISDLEKQKLIDLGYIVTENTVESQYRYGAPDLYIGFQVALNQTATAKSMQIGQVVPGGGSGGTTDYNMLINKPMINNVPLEGNLTLSDLGISELTQAQIAELLTKLP